MNPTSQALTEEYLGRLDAAAWRLPGDRRVELVTEVRAHIDAAMAGQPGDEAALRTVLDNLGAPEEIARAAVEQEGLPLPGPIPNATNLRDISTVLLLMFGGFLAGIGWVVGLALLWTSTRWRTRDKWLATLVWPFGYAGLLVVGTFAAFTPTRTVGCTSSSAHPQPVCTSDGFSLPVWVSLVVLLVALVAPALVSIRLLRTPTVPGPVAPVTAAAQH
jgi:hypothetical protein